MGTGQAFNAALLKHLVELTTGAAITIGDKNMLVFNSAASILLATAGAIFSGRACRSAVIACKSICDHCPSFFISFTSRAIAAQVITRMGAESTITYQHRHPARGY
jgi:hypothetical protein